MDMLLIGTEEGMQVRPISIHGMLWLQTHFEDANWEALASNKVKLPFKDSEALSNDAKEAGIEVTQLSPLSIPGRL